MHVWALPTHRKESQHLVHALHASVAGAPLIRGQSLKGQTYHLVPINLKAVGIDRLKSIFFYKKKIKEENVRFFIWLFSNILFALLILKLSIYIRQF